MKTREELFMSFLESIENKENKEIIDSVKTGFNAMLESSVFRGVAPAATSDMSRRSISSDSFASQGNPVETQAQIDARTARQEREASMARQRMGRAMGSMKQIEKLAELDPIKVEDWMNSKLKEAISVGKREMDREMGTDLSKRGLLSRIKGAARSFVESEEESE